LNLTTTTMDHDNLYASFSLPAGDFVAGLLQIFICLAVHRNIFQGKIYVWYFDHK
jgi:hypothetical protein